MEQFCIKFSIRCCCYQQFCMYLYIYFCLMAVPFVDSLDYLVLQYLEWPLGLRHIASTRITPPPFRARHPAAPLARSAKRPRSPRNRARACARRAFSPLAFQESLRREAPPRPPSPRATDTAPHSGNWPPRH